MTGQLTDRQRQVAQLVAEGLSDKEIATALGVCERRVRQIIGRLVVLLELDPMRNTRVQLARLANRYAA